LHCRWPAHDTETNKMHNTVHRYFMLQYHFEHFYMFWSPRDHHQGIKSKQHHTKLTTSAYSRKASLYNYTTKNHLHFNCLTFYTFLLYARVVGFVWCCFDLISWWWSLGDRNIWECSKCYCNIKYLWTVLSNLFVSVSVVNWIIFKDWLTYVMDKWLACLLLIWEGLISNLSPESGFHGQSFSWFSSSHSHKCWGSIVN
jgi:hypothetical protein